MTKAIKYTPYTYLVGWSKENKYYYGVRYSKSSKCIYDTGCHPDDLWVKYFTSSNYVQKMRECHGEPDIIQIRKTFTSSRKAISWEERVIEKLNIISDKKWLNLNKAGAIYWSDEMKNNQRGKSMQERCGPSWVNPRIGITNPKTCKSFIVQSEKKGTIKFESVKDFREKTGLFSKVAERLRMGEVFNIREDGTGNLKNCIKVSKKHIFEAGDVIRCTKDSINYIEWIYPEQQKCSKKPSLYKPITIYSKLKGIITFKSQAEMSKATGIHQPAIIKLRAGKSLTVKNKGKVNNCIHSKYFKDGDILILAELSKQLK